MKRLYSRPGRFTPVSTSTTVPLTYGTTMSTTAGSWVSPVWMSTTGTTTT